MRDSRMTPLLPSPVIRFACAREANIAISPLSGGSAYRLHAAEIRHRAENGAQYDFYRRDGENSAKICQNLMVDMKATNVKLVDRACRMVVEATGIGREEAETLLKQTDFEVKPAILMALTRSGCCSRRGKLRRSSGLLRAALRTLKRCVWIRRQRSPATFYVVSAESKIFCARKTV